MQTSLFSFSLSTTSYEYAGLNTLILSGTLNNFDSRYSANVVLKRGSTQIATPVVGSNGRWSYTVASDSVDPGSYTYTVNFNGNDKIS